MTISLVVWHILLRVKTIECIRYYMAVAHAPDTNTSMS